MIRGLTDTESVTIGFPEIGRIRKGAAKKKNAEGQEVFGNDLKWFRFTSEYEIVKKTFDKVYGKEPKVIPFYFPYALPDENFFTCKERWTAGSLQHRCDGVTTSTWLDKGHYRSKPEEQIKCPGNCNNIGRLYMILPKLAESLLQEGFVELGYVMMETKSIHDLVVITKKLRTVYMYRDAKGLDLRGMEFSLTRYDKMVSVPGWGDNADGRSRVTKSLVNVTTSLDWAKLALESVKTEEQPKMIGNGVPISPLDVDDAPADEIVEELGPTEVEEGYGETSNFVIRPVEEAKPVALDQQKLTECDSMANKLGGFILKKWESTPPHDPKSLDEWHIYLTSWLNALLARRDLDEKYRALALSQDEIDDANTRSAILKEVWETGVMRNGKDIVVNDVLESNTRCEALIKAWKPKEEVKVEPEPIDDDDPIPDLKLVSEYVVPESVDMNSLRKAVMVAVGKDPGFKGDVQVIDTVNKTKDRAVLVDYAREMNLTFK